MIIQSKNFVQTWTFEQKTFDFIITWKKMYYSAYNSATASPQKMFSFVPNAITQPFLSCRLQISYFVFS